MSQPGQGRGLFLAATREYDNRATSSIRHVEPVRERPGAGAGRGRLFQQLQREPLGPRDHGQSVESLAYGMQSVTLREPSGHQLEEGSICSTSSSDRVITHIGDGGRKVSASTNYIRLEWIGDHGMYEYEVGFDPPVDSIQTKVKLLYQHKDVLGAARSFNGTLLHLPFKLNDQVLRSQFPDGSEANIHIVYKRKKKAKECVNDFNYLIHLIMKKLDLVRIGRQNFDPAGRSRVTESLEVWPGYVTAVDDYEGGVMLCCDVSHRVLRLDNCYKLMCALKENLQQRGKREAEIRKEIRAYFFMKSVITTYNNKVYKISDVDFEKNPMSTFELRSGTSCTFLDYYRQQYDIRLTSKTQPMFIHKDLRQFLDGSRYEAAICLPPEVCNMTGLTDDLRSNFRIMKELSKHTFVDPKTRHQSLRQFIQNVKSNEDAMRLLNAWGLRFADETVDVEARVFENETIMVGNGRKFRVEDSADWTRKMSQHPVLEGINLQHWAIFYVSRDKRLIETFIEHFAKLQSVMGIFISNPTKVPLNNDATATYLASIKEKCKDSHIQIVVIVFPTPRDDRYSGVKRLCCAEIGIPSQVINTRTISRRDKLPAIMHKIAMQMNCKLGGSLWSLTIPLRNVMVCGLDSYHERQHKSNSVVGFVASLDSACTRWYSTICFQSGGQEIVDQLKKAFSTSLQTYGRENNRWPDHVIIYRDGVGDGELKMIRDHELVQMEKICKLVCRGHNPKFTYIVVQKRINTRIFLKSRGSYENPPPGTVVDSVVTRRNWYDFFLVSQLARQGTVSPIHYIVLRDSANMPVDRIQRFTYTMCHLYYNWTGTIKVPAPCQYAHKLAFLIGQNVQSKPHTELSDKLYFL